MLLKNSKNKLILSYPKLRMSNITSNEHFLIRNRNLRNELLKKTDYLMLSDVFNDLTEEQQLQLKAYRKILRDFINENKDKYLIEGKWDIQFPIIPKWINIQNPKY